MDFQPVLNHYKAVTNICSYLSKQEGEYSQAMMQAVKEAAKNNPNGYQRMNNVLMPMLQKENVLFRKQFTM